MRITAGITIFVLSAASFAFEKPPELFPVRGVGGAHSAGELSWSDSMATTKSKYFCPYGSKLTDQKTCHQTVLVVQSQAKAPMWCRAIAVLNEPDAFERRQVEEGSVLHPGDSRTVLTVDGPRSLKIETFETHCEALPNAPLPPLEPADCKSTLRSASSPEDYYPPAAKRAGLTGVVTVEFVLPDQPGKLENVRVVATSGEADFDIAALKMYKSVRATVTCPGVRVRTNVVFKLHD